MEPSSDLMTNNIRFYSTEFKLTSGQFQARKVLSVIVKFVFMSKYSTLILGRNIQIFMSNT